jgi:hypothetical protein
MSSCFIDRRNEKYCVVNGKVFRENQGPYLVLVLQKWRFVCNFAYYSAKSSLSKTCEYEGLPTDQVVKPSDKTDEIGRSNP